MITNNQIKYFIDCFLMLIGVCDQYLTLCVYVLQVRTFFTKVLNEEERQRLCQNMAGALKGAQVFIQKRWVCSHHHHH